MIRPARFSIFPALSAALAACGGTTTQPLDGATGKASAALESVVAPDTASALAAGNGVRTLSAPLSATGQADDSADPLVDLVVAAKSSAPLTFRVLQSQLQQVEQGFHVSGTLRVPTPAGEISLFQADATFEFAPGSNDIQSLRGSARVPFSDFGLSSTTIDAPSAEFGIDLGGNLGQIQAPLVADRRYLYFQFSDKLEVNAGPLTISAPNGQEHTVVVDPSDPYFFVRADLAGFGRVSEFIQNVGIGVSMRGNIPFTPKNTWGISDVQPLRGHFYLDLTGSVPLGELPVSLKGQGETVIDLDPLGTGETIFQDPAAGMRVGANRELDLSLDLIPDVATVEVELGEGTLQADLLKTKSRAWLSGVVYPNGKSLFSDVLGVVPASQLLVAANLNSPITDSSLDLAGDTTIALSKLGDLIGLSIDDARIGAASLHAARDGLSLSGRLDASFLTGLGVNAGARLDAKFAGNPAKNGDWYVQVNGGLALRGVDLSSAASARLSRNGLHVLGTFASPLGQSVSMEGDVTRDRFAVTGSADVTIPIANYACSCKLPKMCDEDVLCQKAKQCQVPASCDVASTCQVPKTCKVPRQCPIANSCSVRDCTSKCNGWNIFGCISHLVTCSTKTVTDAGRCGVSIVTDAAKCGAVAVTDATQCGTSTVTSAATCGVHTVTDAATCGTRTVRDAASCGSDWVKCGTKQVQCGTIDAAGAACGSVCDGQITQDLGTFKGHITLTVGPSGLSGSVEGDYVNGGVTQHLAGGRLDLSSTPRACISVPGLGEFCHQF